MIHQLIIEDPVWTYINGKTAQLLNNELSFKKQVIGNFARSKNKKGKRFVYETIRMIDALDMDLFRFPTGLIYRACDCLDDYGVQYDVIDKVGAMPHDDPYLPDVDLRYYQHDLIHQFLLHQRGVIHAATASGKTFVCFSICSAFPKNTILILVDSKDLVYKMYDDLIKYGFKGVGEWSGRRKSLGRLTVGTVQSYHKIHEQHAHVFDIILIDEGHHVSSFDGLYADILETSKARVRGAFTATLPYLPEAKNALEAYIGPVIGEYTISDGVDDGFLAKPEVTMYETERVPYWIMKDTSWHPKGKSTPSKYERIYMNGIVLNEKRNLYICEDISTCYHAGEIILINVKRIKHGHILMDILKNKYPDVDCLFASGTTKNREYIIDAMEKKEIRAVIATTIFNEGIDIPSLNTLINAAGEYSEIAIIQKIGRTTRTGPDGNKKNSRIIDYYDASDKILEKHSKKRLKIYKENGWI